MHSRTESGARCWLAHVVSATQGSPCAQVKPSSARTVSVPCICKWDGSCVTSGLSLQSVSHCFTRFLATSAFLRTCFRHLCQCIMSRAMLARAGQAYDQVYKRRGPSQHTFRSEASLRSVSIASRRAWTSFDDTSSYPACRSRHAPRATYTHHCVAQQSKLAVAPFGRGTAAAAALSLQLLPTTTYARLRPASRLLRDWLALQQVATLPTGTVGTNC